MRADTMSIQELLTQMQHHHSLWNTLFEDLVTRANIQHYTEQQCTELLELLRQSIMMVGTLQKGDSIDEAWVDRRNDLLQQARRFLLDEIEDWPHSMVALK